jgi:hypothetical protein
MSWTNLPAVPVPADAAVSNHTPRDHSPSVNDSSGSEARESTEEAALADNRDSRGGRHPPSRAAYMRSYRKRPRFCPHCRLLLNP